MVRRLAPVTMFVALACTPQSADISDLGILAMLSDSTSLTLAKNAVDLGGFDASWNIDCLDRSDEAFRLPNALDVCGSDGVEVGGGRDVSWPLFQEASMNFSAFRVGELVDAQTWRAEAVMTSEDDFQLTFHVRLPGGADMRLAVAVDPTFQPRQCVVDSEGGVSAEPLDGNWVEEWSKDMSKLLDDVDQAGGNGDQLYPDWMVRDAEDFSDGRLFYLNARSYQWDPGETCIRWTLPNRWRAGWAQGKFAEELFVTRTTRYGSPRAYATTDADEFECVEPTDLYYFDTDPGTDVSSRPAWRALRDRAANEAGVVRDELAFMHQDQATWFRPMIHDNEWRVPDGRPSGLDGWIEMQNAWVMFDKDSDISVGGSAKGAFGMLFASQDSQSVFLVHGRFDVERIRKDRWTTKNIPEIKLEEYGTEICL